MTKELKKSATWYIAATHYITAGFAIPFIVSLILGFGVKPFIENEMAFMVLGSVTQLAALWFGVMYSANYLKKTYIIPDAAKVVTLATTYLLVIRGAIVAFMLWGVSYLVSQGGTAPEAMNATLYVIVEFILALGIFYIASKKYVVATVPDEPQTAA